MVWTVLHKIQFQNAYNNIYSYLLLSDVVCVHCRKFKSYRLDMYEIVEHCKICPAMHRPDHLKYKFVCMACTSFHTWHPGNMRNHINIHLGAKPFACTLCDYRSVQKVHLKNHMARFHYTIM